MKCRVIKLPTLANMNSLTNSDSSLTNVNNSILDNKSVTHTNQNIRQMMISVIDESAHYRANSTEDVDGERCILKDE